MKILALEFSSDARSVAFGDPVGPIAELTTAPTDRRSTGIALVDRLLRQASATPADIDLIAIALGPGSYAGIRSAIALAQGWQLARGTRLVGLSTVDILAREAQKRGLTGSIAVIIDAQRGELYRADFDLSPVDVRQTGPLAIVSREDVVSTVPLVGPHATLVTHDALDLFPSAATLLHLASQRSDYTPGELLEPIYLRETTFVKAPAPRFPAF